MAQGVQRLCNLPAVPFPPYLRQPLQLPLGRRFADFEHLDGLLASFGTELKENRVAKWGEMNTRLHMYMYRHCGQPLTLGIVHKLLKQTDRFTRLNIKVTAGQVRAQEQHYGLVLRCREGLFDEAVKLLKAHIENAGTVLRRFVESSR